MNQFAKLIPPNQVLLSKMPSKKILISREPSIIILCTISSLRMLRNSKEPCDSSVSMLVPSSSPEPHDRLCPPSIHQKMKQPSTQFLRIRSMDSDSSRWTSWVSWNLTIIDRALRIIENNHGVKSISMHSHGRSKVLTSLRRVTQQGYFNSIRGYASISAGAGAKYIWRYHRYEVSVSTRSDALHPDLHQTKTRKRKVKYPHESLAQILQLTQGIAVYQEQIMQIVQAFAGFSLGEADILRRAMGKKIKELMDEQKENLSKQRPNSDTVKNSLPISSPILSEPFAGYGFNKSHAACYSMIAYQTAYLKAYYPTEFLTALMVSDEDDTDRIVLEINEARSKWIQVLVPDVNESRRHFTYIDKGRIRFGLKAIKWVWDRPIDTILRGREEGGPMSLSLKTSWSVLAQMLSIKNPRCPDKKAEQWTLWESVDTCSQNMERMAWYLREVEHKTTTKQMGMFDLGGEQTGWGLILEDGKELSFEEKIREERNAIEWAFLVILSMASNAT